MTREMTERDWWKLRRHFDRKSRRNSAVRCALMFRVTSERWVCVTDSSSGLQALRVNGEVRVCWRSDSPPPSSFAGICQQNLNASPDASFARYVHRKLKELQWALAEARAEQCRCWEAGG